MAYTAVTRVCVGMCFCHIHAQTRFMGLFLLCSIPITSVAYAFTSEELYAVSLGRSVQTDSAGSGVRIWSHDRRIQSRECPVVFSTDYDRVSAAGRSPLWSAVASSVRTYL